MVLVAIAGGTSEGLGRSIVTALLAHRDHAVVVLSRTTSKTPTWLNELPVEVRKVDYTSSNSLRAALVGVHTVVSVMKPLDGTWASSQIALLHAAVAIGARRFAPSEFAVGPAAAEWISIFAPKLQVWRACEEVAIEHPGFEWTRFCTGMLMNYLGYGAPREREALAGKEDDGESVWYQRDIHGWKSKGLIGKVRIPVQDAESVARGDAKVPRVTLTEIGDVGRFVAAACSLPQGSWEKDLGMIGQVLRIDEVSTIIEEVRGGKLEVEYVEIDELQRQRKEKESEGDTFGAFWLDLDVMTARDKENESVIRGRCNELFPDVKPMQVEEYMKKYWA